MNPVLCPVCLGYPNGSHENGMKSFLRALQMGLCERTTATHFPHDPPEERLDLVQRQTVLRRTYVNPLILGHRVADLLVAEIDVRSTIWLPIPRLRTVRMVSTV